MPFMGSKLSHGLEILVMLHFRCRMRTAGGHGRAEPLQRSLSEARRAGGARGVLCQVQRAGGLGGARGHCPRHYLLS